MRLTGIRAAFLGDSITEGWAVEDLEKVYYKVLAERTGITVFGYGVGGTRITRSSADETRRDFLLRAETMEEALDLIVVEGGTNDFGLRSPLLGAGEFAFEGACRALFEKLEKKYPEARIVVMLPLHRSDEVVSRENESGEEQLPLTAYREKLLQIANEYALPTVDMYTLCPIDPRKAGDCAQYCPDGLHPNIAGHALMADTLQAVLEKL